ncbi:hypothetical protein C7M84_022857 [Penaeus vannamei]|uniref:Uncharacterized protein n=1 Tax=Penaeus vannamei TaxID=6689 RepID=A0A3R7QYV4_PENVA|nr:hypothetical protein C7M84_022857 [Penaeus vannamei]
MGILYRQGWTMRKRSIACQADTHRDKSSASPPGFINVPTAPTHPMLPQTCGPTCVDLDSDAPRTSKNGTPAGGRGLGATNRMHQCPYLDTSIFILFLSPALLVPFFPPSHPFPFLLLSSSLSLSSFHCFSPSHCPLLLLS